MSLCIAASGTFLALAANTFTLSWTHSVEKTIWTENWAIEAGYLVAEEATVQGAGAGIDLPDNARRIATGWAYTPQLPPLPELVLAASGATVTGWTLCVGETCVDLGEASGAPIKIWAASSCQADH